MKNYLQKIDLTNPRYLNTLVENRRIFNLKHSELNIFESYQKAFLVPLKFNDLVITSMVRGKKVMHLHEKPSFDYLPGESVIVPANECMVIDFPEAEIENPTQCIALAIDSSYISDTLDYLNQYYSDGPGEHESWALHFNQYHFSNETEVTDLINKIITVSSSDNRSKNIFADLHIKELLIRIVQSQQLQVISSEESSIQNKSRLHYVLHYIQEHLTDKIEVDTLSRKAYLSRNVFFRWFKGQFGITPLEYINRQRIKMAKQLLNDSKNSVSDVSLQCGFNDVNYFVRTFKKSEGITPGSYQSSLIKK